MFWQVLPYQCKLYLSINLSIYLYNICLSIQYYKRIFILYRQIARYFVHFIKCLNHPPSFLCNNQPFLQGSEPITKKSCDSATGKIPILLFVHCSSSVESLLDCIYLYTFYLCVNYVTILASLIKLEHTLINILELEK